eukprot:Gb_13330 [translate_table: standard]
MRDMPSFIPRTLSPISTKGDREGVGGRGDGRGETLADGRRREDLPVTNNLSRTGLKLEMEKKMEGGGRMSPCDTEALRKCLEEHKGDRHKCQEHIDAFKSACSTKRPSSPPPKVLQGGS